MSNIDESMYRLTLAQRDAAWREAEAWKKRFEALSDFITKTALMHVYPAITPVKLADADSYELGRLHGATAERKRICEAIKEEDDYCVTEGDYMLDSDDCIAVANGKWVRPDYSVDATQAKGKA